MKASRTFILLAAILVVGFFVSVWCQRDMGLADNSDFTRSIYSFTPGPVGLPAGWLDYHSDAGEKRYFHYWLPRWDLHWYWQRPITSAELLWIPGVLAAEAGVSGGKLDLRVISLFPKLLLLGQLLLVIAWAWHQRAFRVTLLLALGVPALLVFTTTDYLVYLQSFYQESGTLVFILPLLFAMVYFDRKPTGSRLAILLVCLALLTTSKRADFYWPLLAFPFILASWLAAHPAHREKRRWLAAAAVGLVGALVVTVGSLRATDIRATGANAYQSFFFGALTFSSHPAEHLRRFGLEYANDCVGQSAYTPAGLRFRAEHPNEITFRHVLLTYLREPRAILPAVSHVFSNMQDLSLEFLGHYALEDPRAGPVTTPNWFAAEGRFWGADEGTVWNLWSALKFRFFPTGWALGVWLAIFAGWFGWGLRGGGVTRELAMIGLVATLACPVDMGVAVVGEGRADLIKHLFLANLLFDIAVIAFVGSWAVWLQERVRQRADRD